jgi:hypothetical protein
VRRRTGHRRTESHHPGHDGGNQGEDRPCAAKRPSPDRIRTTIRSARSREPFVKDAMVRLLVEGTSCGHHCRLHENVRGHGNDERRLKTPSPKEVARPSPVRLYCHGATCPCGLAEADRSGGQGRRSQPSHLSQPAIHWYAMLRRAVFVALLLCDSVAAAQSRPDPLESVPALGSSSRAPRASWPTSSTGSPPIAASSAGGTTPPTLPINGHGCARCTARGRRA